MSGKKRVPEIDTAMHVVKGAVVKVLGTPLTTAVEAHKANEGRLTVRYDAGNAPVQAELDRIIELANEKIKENAAVTVTKMARADAEAKYTAAPVNSTYIYDNFPVPESVTELTIVEIDGWNVNACSGNHLESTGSIREVQLKNVNFRPQKNELQLVLDFAGAGGAAAKGGRGNPKQKQQKARAAKGAAAPAPAAAVAAAPTTTKRPADDLGVARGAVVEAVLQGLASLDKEKFAGVTAEQLVAAAGTDIDVALTSLRNASYTRGAASVQNVATGPRT